MVEQGLINRERSLELLQAERQVNRFVHRFQPNYRRLAYYAALPLVLTPELLHYLRIQFLRGEGVPWVAEVDLLLSDLCQPVGYEQYAMETPVRAYLLQEMEHQLGRSPMIEAASLLIRYVDELARTNALSEQELEAQHLAALLILDEEQAVRQVATAYSHTLSSSNQRGLSRAGRTELARLSSLTQELSPQIRQHENLVDYARIVQQLLNNNYTENTNLTQRSFLIFDDLELNLPDDLIPAENQAHLAGFPPFQTFEFDVATIAFETPTPSISLQPFLFTLATLTEPLPTEMSVEDKLVAIEEALLGQSQQNLNDTQRALIRGSFQNRTYHQIAEQLSVNDAYLKFVGAKLWQLLTPLLEEWVTKKTLPVAINQWLWQRCIQREQREGQQFIEYLDNGFTLEMVQIPEGIFLMGSPEDEEGRNSNENPPHWVNVQSFFMGKFPVTQKQWKAVAALPQVERQLNLDPSSFKAENHPVENVSWKDAVEFCDRLSQHTGKHYRLPSEAEWEYACRAGTTTPFHFGETITTDLANYDGNFTYGNGPKGVDRNQTTPVGSFGVANAFGLYDMHGNVWEWCADHWHENYEGAPVDGSAWVTGGDSDYLVLRGGSWSSYPQNCRSAYRLRFIADLRLNDSGFRVACSA